MIPWLIGAAVVGIATAIISSDDDNNSTVGKIKEVIKDFWQDVKDAFLKAVAGISGIILADKTEVRKDSSGIENENTFYYKDSNGDLYERTIETKTKKLSGVPEWVTTQKKDITNERRKIVDDD